MSDFFLLVVLSAVVYRVTRFIIEDTLLDGPREKLLTWLEEHPGFMNDKLYVLIECPFCVSIWVSAGAVALTDLVVDDVPVPVWTWLAAATGALVFWAIIDSE